MNRNDRPNGNSGAERGVNRTEKFAGASPQRGSSTESARRR